jgi:hypothetical protein
VGTAERLIDELARKNPAAGAVIYPRLTEPASEDGGAGVEPSPLVMSDYARMEGTPHDQPGGDADGGDIILTGY